MTDGAVSVSGSGRVEDVERPTRGGFSATVAQWVEVHRLAVAGQEPVIARDVGHRMGRVWLPRSRFADVAALARATLTLGPDANTFYDLGWAQSFTGQPRQALTGYEQALNLHREAGDRVGEAATLTNIGGIRFRQGDLSGAKDAFDEVLEIVRVVGDLGSEAGMSFNMAVLLVRMGRVDDAVEFQRWAVALAEQARHPALEQMRAFLMQLQQAMEG